MLNLDLSLKNKAMIYTLLSHQAKKQITDKDVAVSVPEYTAAPGTDLETISDMEVNTRVVLTYVEGSTVVDPGGQDNLPREYIRKKLSTVAARAEFNGEFLDDFSKWNQSSNDNAYKTQVMNDKLKTNFDTGELFFSITSETPDEAHIAVTVTDLHYGIFGKFDIIVKPIA